MKRYKMWLVLLLSLSIGCGNGQNTEEEKTAEQPTQIEISEQKEILKQQEDTSKKTDRSEQSETEKRVYTSDYLWNIDDIALTADGRLYAVGLQPMNTVYNEDVLEITQAAQWLYEFDSNGICVCMGKMLFSQGEAMALEWSEESLYMIVPGINRMPVLYQVEHLSEVDSEVVQTLKKLREADPDTNYIQEYLDFRDLDIWNLQELYRFDTFSEIKRLVFIGDRLYVHGTLENSDETSVVQNIAYLETHQNSYKEQAVGYVDMQNLEAGVMLLQMDGVPKDMIKLTEDTLGIYLMGEKEACFWKYEPLEEKWEQTDIAEVKYSEVTEEVLNYDKFAAYEDGCFYVKDADSVCYKTINDTEQELFESDGAVQVLETDGTFLYYSSKEWSTKEVRRIRISELLPDKGE